MKIISFEKEIGKTQCTAQCTYWNGAPLEHQKHSCGKHIYETWYKCSECGKEGYSKAVIKAHQTVVHKGLVTN